LPAVASDANAIKNAIHHKVMVEFEYTEAFMGYFEMRKEDLLQPGTLLHFPVTARALESLPAENYTFGGSQGEAGMDYSTCGCRQFTKNYSIRFIFKSHFLRSVFLFDIFCIALNIVCLQVVFSQSFNIIIN
jgi:hypothetical protein